MALADDEATLVNTRSTHSQFFPRMALLMLGLVLASFSMTYFVPMYDGSRSWPPVVHIHGVFSFAWMLLYVWQARLVATGRVALHRELGLAGIAISALMIPLGVATIVVQAHKRLGLGIEDPFSRSFLTLMGLTTFAVMMTAAIASVTRHREWHRRFIYAAALVLVQFAGSRLLLHFRGISHFEHLVLLLPDLFLVALMVHDRRVSGAVHPATLWITAVLVPLHVVAPFVAHSAAWAAFAPALLRLSG